MAATPDELFRRLDALGIVTRTHRHPPLHTVADSKRLRGQLPGGHIKNLFLRDKKRRIWLVTVLEDRAVDLKALRRRLGAQGTLSFGDATLLMEVLGVAPGAVTPFAVINDQEHRVTVVLDRAVLDRDPVNCHPLVNDMTTAIACGDLRRFVAACGHALEVIDFDHGADARG
jgi:Ala-tRNA(Pro) deacylase